MNRFDYVKYDDTAERKQRMFKEQFKALEETVYFLKAGRARDHVMDCLEEAYMWVGKAIRDEQIERNGSAELLETRRDG